MRMSICVITAWNGPTFDKLGPLAWENRKAYCERHGYELRGGAMCGVGPWVKLLLLSRYISEFDWCAWVDADAMILNHDIRLETLLNTRADLIASCDKNGLNAGVFFFRRSPWSSGFVERWGAGFNFFRRVELQEQTALAYLLYREPKERWEIRPQEQFNSYLEGYKQGDFILHLPCRSQEDRLKIFGLWLPK